MTLHLLYDESTNPPEPDDLYLQLERPEPSEDRPYLYLNMVSTADGKIVLGEVGGSAKGVGGPMDQLLFRRLQFTCDAAMLGSSTLRATQVLYPPEKPRFVVTRKGDIPLNNRFFTDAPNKAYILAPEDLPQEQMDRLRAGAKVIAIGQGGVDWKATLRYLRQEMGIHILLCEGGATLNDELLRAGMVDELFLTIAPKLKGGAHLPTAVEGQGFPPGKFASLTLLSLYQDADEIYLRYRVGAVEDRK